MHGLAVKNTTSKREYGLLEVEFFFGCSSQAAQVLGCFEQNCFCSRIAQLGKLIYCFCPCRNFWAWMLERVKPVHQFTALNANVFEQSISKLHILEPPVQCPTEFLQSLMSNPISAAFVTKTFAPTTNSNRLTVCIFSPCHRTRARQNKYPWISCQCACECHSNIVLHSAVLTSPSPSHLKLGV